MARAGKRVGAGGDSRDARLAAVQARLALASGQDEVEEIGRSDLASVVFHASPELLDDILRQAMRDNRLRQCLAAARYYSGLGQDTCERIDAVLRTPFPAARRRGRR